ncbi:MAG: hypothetical protein ACLTMP_05580 [Eggerthella lenta]
MSAVVSLMEGMRDNSGAQRGLRLEATCRLSAEVERLAARRGRLRRPQPRSTAGLAGLQQPRQRGRACG